MRYIPEGITFLKRDAYYDLSTTSFTELLISFAKLVQADIYVLTHTTAPFLKANSIFQGIKQVVSGEYDSAVSVVKLQEFLWADDKPLNYNLENIPRTQDLKPIYSETCGLYVYTRDLIINQKRRVGECPYLVEVSKIEACDINDKEDFLIADAIFNMSKQYHE